MWCKIAKWKLTNMRCACELRSCVSTVNVHICCENHSYKIWSDTKNSGLAGWRHLWVSWILERYIRRWLHKCLKSTEPRQALQKNIKPSIRLLRAAWLKEGPLLRNDSAATASTARYTGAGPATPSASSLDAFIREELLPQLLITPPPSNEPISLEHIILSEAVIHQSQTPIARRIFEVERFGICWENGSREEHISLQKSLPPQKNYLRRKQQCLSKILWPPCVSSGRLVTWISWPTIYLKI